MSRRPPGATRTDTRVPYTTLFRSLGGGADDNFLVEGPEVLQRAAAARDDEQIRARQPPLLRQGVETADRRGDLLRGALALHQHRPYQHAERKAVGEAVQDVADDGAGDRKSTSLNSSH